VRRLREGRGLGRRGSTRIEAGQEVHRPHDYAERLLRRLRAPRNVKRRTEEILVGLVRTLWHQGKKPSSVACAAIYLAWTDVEPRTSPTQKRLADEAGITTVTIRNNVKGIRKLLQLA